MSVYRITCRYCGNAFESLMPFARTCKGADCQRAVYSNLAAAKRKRNPERERERQARWRANNPERWKELRTKSATHPCANCGATCWGLRCKACESASRRRKVAS